VGRALRLLGMCLILAGIGLGAFELFQDWHADSAYRSTQQALRKELQTDPRNGLGKGLPRGHQESAAPSPTEALAVLRIPRFGPEYAPVIVEGVSQDDLAKGPGHYPGSAMPGDIGNFAVAGHRTGWGQPFHRLPELRKGDAISVEWRQRSYTYHVTRTKVVEPSDVGVVLPVPNRPGTGPDKARITLTTCVDRGRDGTYAHRLVVWGELDAR